jgi:antitoxin (DNA-binding transcriptional repressor) of toxin-antitoxin stability system
MDDKWEISDESSLLELLDRLTDGTSVDVTYHGQVVGSFIPNDMVDETTAAAAVEHLLKLDVIEPGPGFRFKDLVHEGHKY